LIGFFVFINYIICFEIYKKQKTPFV